jgi:hypothetical protein
MFYMQYVYKVYFDVRDPKVWLSDEACEVWCVLSGVVYSSDLRECLRMAPRYRNM